MRAALALLLLVSAGPVRADVDCATVEECGQRGVAARLGTLDVKQDLPLARALLERACALGRGQVAACTDLAELLNGGLGGEREALRARDVLDRACSAREPRACAYLGLIFTEGLGVPFRPEYFRVGAALYKKSCELGRAGACWHYGMLLRDGHGVRRDAALARRYFRRACDAGESIACDDLKTMGEKR